MPSKADPTVEKVAMLVDSHRALHEEVRQMRLQLAQQSRMLRGLLQRHPEAANAEAGGERAGRALASMRKRLKPHYDGGAEDMEASEQASEAAKATWIHEGRLISSKEMGASWHRTRQALEQACERGELFNLKIANRRWYPAAFAALDAEQVKAVCQRLRALDPVSSFIFWERIHGSLGGKTITQAIQEGRLPAVLRAAEVFAGEQAG